MKQAKNNYAPPDLLRWGKRLSTAAAGLFALGALIAVFYYIIYPSQAYFHSDCTDTLLWAKASVDAKALFNPDFSYAAMLPFGGVMLMIPFVAIFGVGMTAHHIGMVLFTLLFFLAVWLLCRSLKFSLPLSLLTIGTLAMTLAASGKLREIFYEHVIYYSICILVLCVLLSLYLRCTAAGTERLCGRQLALWIFACVFTALTALDGMQILATGVFPVLFAGAMDIFCCRDKLFSKENKPRLFFCGAVVLSALIGLLLLSQLSSRLQSGYAAAYSSYSDPAEWLDNLFKFPTQWMLLFGAKFEPFDPMFSVGSLLSLVRLAFAALIAGGPFAALVLLKRFARPVRLLIAAHFGLFAVIFFGYVCGLLSAANWRLSPLICTGLLVCMACLQVMRPHPVARRFATLGVILCLVMSALSLQSILAMPKDGAAENQKADRIAALESYDLKLGYATFWNAQSITVLTDSDIRIASVQIQDGAVLPYYYQTERSWFEEAPGCDRYFLLLDTAESAMLAGTGLLDTAAETYDLGEFQIYVFPHIAEFLS
ncbi:MAG: hypothetical protein IJK64_01315 [Clostridia bacterium]|nr:hypothetical protein [Clostridia bacterium]